MYRSTPFLYDVDISPLNVGINAVNCVPQPNSARHPRPHPSTPATKPFHPCPPCVIKGFENEHFPLTRACGVRKLGSAEILQIISDNHLCPSCARTLKPGHSCKVVFPDGYSKVCTIGCKLNEIPVNKFACKHSDRTPSISVSRVVSDRSIPLVENVPLGALTLGVQYDTGCQLSLISKSGSKPSRPLCTPRGLPPGSGS